MGSHQSNDSIFHIPLVDGAPQEALHQESGSNGSHLFVFRAGVSIGGIPYFYFEVLTPGFFPSHYGFGLGSYSVGLNTSGLHRVYRDRVNMSVAPSATIVVDSYIYGYFLKCSGPDSDEKNICIGRIDCSDISSMARGF